MTLIQQKMSLLSLSMKPSLELEKIAGHDEALDSLAVMTSQDTVYRARDYIGRRRKRAEDGGKPVASEEVVDPACREKMCEWSYRVSDHFGVDREIVAFSISFLDRFIDRCSCDRTAFKLAAMTSLYIATKMLNVKQISIASLAELSRGEFQAEHIAQMERIILSTLDYRMNPPTAQAFIQLLRTLFPNMEGSISDAVYKRSLFYAELCVYDYCFVTEDRYKVAVACILNALLDVEGTYGKDLQDEFIATLESSLCVDLSMESLEKSQTRLWYLYSCSAQSKCDEIHSTYHSDDRIIKDNASNDSSGYAYSPVSVNNMMGPHYAGIPYCHSNL